MAYVNALANALSDTFTDERYPLGSTFMQTTQDVDDYGSGVSDAVTWSLLSGERVWVFVKAASAIKVGDLCKRNAAGTPFEAAPDAADATIKHKLAGVADHVIASGSYGWIIKDGPCVYRTDTSGGGKAISAFALVDSDGSSGAAGEVNTAAGTDASVLGYVLEAADATLADFAQGRVSIP